VKIKLWQAFASNNSGSYTIVGSFQTVERARDVVSMLRVLLREHSAWVKTAEQTGDLRSAESPLAVFCHEHGLPWQQGLGMEDDWPQYDDREPKVVVAGRQVLVHVSYTVTMPSTFGEFIYKSGGRVATELDHAHDPIVATFTVWWSDWAKGAERAHAVIAELTSPGGPLVTSCSFWHPPAWRVGDKTLEGQMLLVCVFQDLCAGVAAVHDVIVRHDGQSQLAISELHSHADPLKGLRPSNPASTTPRYDVWLGELAKTPQLRTELARALSTNENTVNSALDKAPGTAFKCLFEPVAQRVAAVLKAQNVEHELRPVP
jgi:hypothetical protein